MRWPGLLAVLLVACSNPGPSRIPGVTTTYQVEVAVERGPYLDVLLRREGQSLRYFFPDSEECRNVLRSEAIVEWSALGTVGQVRGTGGSCTAVGIGSLAVRRDTRARGRQALVPHGTARFSVVWEGADYAMVRGRFPLLGNLGWTGGADTVALIPRRPDCAEVLGQGTGTLEFRASGPEPLVFPSRAGACPIEGLLQPLSGI